MKVDDGGNVKICDFGLSRFTTRSFHSTLGKLKGTYAYSAPELYSGELYRYFLLPFNSYLILAIACLFLKKWGLNVAV